MFRIAAALASIALAASVTASPLDGIWRNGFKACFDTGQRIAFQSDDGTPIEGWLWLSRCAAPRAPGVVLLHGCSGVYPNDYGDESKGSTRYPDSLPTASRQDYWSARADIVAVHATEENDRPRDAQGGYAALIALIDEHAQPRVDPARVGLFGWSHGGSAALATIARGRWPQQPFATAQIYYPGCGLYNALGNPDNGTSAYVADVPPDRVLRPRAAFGYRRRRADGHLGVGRRGA